MSLRGLTVEVIYLEKGRYKSRKFVSYPISQAWEVYSDTLEKFEREQTAALVCVRDGLTDSLISCDRTGAVVEPKSPAIGSKKRLY
jgi:hypothetical protein